MVACRSWYLIAHRQPSKPYKGTPEGVNWSRCSVPSENDAVAKRQSSSRWGGPMAASPALTSDGLCEVQ
eukprot:2992204-Pyramimonas_sp.AAC.2